MCVHLSRGKIIQILVAVVVNLLAISDGMHYGWPSAIAPILQSPENPDDVTHDDVTLLEAIYLVGGFAALPYVMYFPDKIGRKYTILGAVFVNFISWMLIATCSNVTAYTISRFLAGMTADMGYVSIPMYIAEIAEKDIRGALCGFIYIFLSLGTCVIYSTGPFLPITISALIGLFINVVALICFIFLPESPYYLLKKNRVDKAEKSLMFLRGTENVKVEFYEIKAGVERQEQEEGKFSDLITSKGNRKALILIVIIFVWQSISGIHVIFMNVNTILEETSNHSIAEYGPILYSVTLLITGIISTFIVDKFGRKRQLVVSGFLIGIALALLATYSFLQISNYHITDMYDWIPLFCILLYAVSLRIGIGFIPFVLNGEIFPTSVKAKGMTIADGFYLIAGILSIVLYRTLEKELGMYVPLYILSIGTVIIAIVVCIYLPETKGKSLEEIQLMLLK